MCKIILYIRNSTRLSSSYLVVFFAYERYVVISSPLKRLQLHNKKFTHLVISLIFVFSFLITSYTPFVDGLRKVDHHELYADKYHSEYECDVLKDYKYVYEYIMFGYTIIGILVPILLVCFFNIYIAAVLLTRKNRIQRHYSKNNSNLNEHSNNSKQFILKTQKSIKSRSFDWVNYNRANRKSLKVNSNIYSYHRRGSNELEVSCNELKEIKHLSDAAVSKPTFQLNNTKAKLKESGRATIILILISVFFIGLNLPYTVAWSLFYMPFQRTLKKESDIYFRYSFVLLTEVFHILNFSVNFFLYCMASKSFRNQFRNKFVSFKCG